MLHGSSAPKIQNSSVGFSCHTSHYMFWVKIEPKVFRDTGIHLNVY